MTDVPNGTSRRRTPGSTEPAGGGVGNAGHTSSAMVLYLRTGTVKFVNVLVSRPATRSSRPADI